MKTSRFSYMLAATVLLSALPASAQSLEERVAKLERTLGSTALVEMMTENQQLRQTLQTLQGEVELLRRDVDEMKTHQRELFADIDRRLRALETTAPAPQTADAPIVAPTVPAEAGATPAQPPADAAPQDAAGNELGDYQAAFALLKAGSYARASEAFQAFLRNHPNGRYADNARYWLGESYYVVRDFDRALPEFQKVVEAFANSPKRPDALLKIGFIHHERGNLAEAQSTLEQVVREFPNTTAAALAEQRLTRLRR